MDKDLDKFEEALDDFSRAMSRPRMWSSVQKSANVSIDRPGAYLLKALSLENGSCQLQNLATKIGVEAPSVSRTAKKLEQQNLITRTVDQHDHRVSHLSPTAEGYRVLNSLQQAKRDYFKILFSGWPSQERRQLVDLLHQLAVQANQITEEKNDITS